jgi:hypothetical protein
MGRAGRFAILAATLFSTCAVASDINPLGFYLGAAVGQGRDTIEKVDNIGFAQSEVARATGWKALVGLRPIRFLGAEVEYIDFGSSNTHEGLVNLSTRADAGAIYALGYLPIPLPFLDIFGKAGWARTHTTASVSVSCAPPALCIVGGNANSTDSDFAYGAGVQARFKSVAFRAEYERTSTSVGHPDLLSFGITWTF